MAETETVVRRCGNCVFMRERKESDSSLGSGHIKDRFWCALNQIPTEKQFLRCGGDDWEHNTLD